MDHKALVAFMHNFIMFKYMNQPFIYQSSVKNQI